MKSVLDHNSADAAKSKHASSETSLLQHAQGVASGLSPLMMKAIRTAATVTLGTHGRRKAGPGDTFWQFRQYMSGNAVQTIDWRQSAKTDQIYVREREWDAAQTSSIWCDMSPSMQYRSRKDSESKAERAALLALALSSLLISGGEKIHFHGSASSKQRIPSIASTGRLALEHMTYCLTRALRGPGEESLPELNVPLPQHVSAILFSDFLVSPAKIESIVRTMAANRATGHLIQILDPAEETFPFRGRIRFSGLENEGSTVIQRTEDIKNQYQRRLNNHRITLEAVIRDIGWTYITHRTDQPPQMALMALHNVLSGETYDHRN